MSVNWPALELTAINGQALVCVLPAVWAGMDHLALG